MAKITATSKTLTLLRFWGWYYWPVERFNAFSGRRTDLFHIIDYVVITPFSTIGVQSCGTDFAGHVKKLCVEEEFHTEKWLRNPSRRLIIIGWRKVLKRRGLKTKVYKPRVAWVYIKGNKLICEEKNYAHYETIRN